MTHVRYHDPTEVAYLDQNVYNPKDATIFPKALYSGEPVPSPRYARGLPRDTDMTYIIDKERSAHPPHFSHFRYERCPNEYCVGVWPGRYITNCDCARGDDEEPHGVAPPRMYDPGRIGPFNVNSHAIRDYNSVMKNGTQHQLR